MKCRILHLLAVITSLFICSEAVFAAPPAGAPIMPFSDIKKGMTGTGYTTFEGVEPEPFQVEIIGLVYDFIGPGQHLIVALLHGEKIEFTGIISGMSGSPVYIDNKIIGAVGYSFTPFGKEVLVGITPIESMISGAAVYGSPLKHDKTLSQMKASPVDLIEVTGIKDNLVSSKERNKNLTRLIPGGPIATFMISGDISMAAVGTITDIRDGIIYAFGHSFNGTGHVAIPFSSAEIVRVVSSYQQSYKMANTGPVIGTVYEDRSSGIMARAGEIPVGIPVKVHLQLPDKKEDFVFDIVKDKELTPQLLLVAVQNILSSGIDYQRGGTFAVSGTFEVPGYGRMAVKDYLSDPGSSLVQLAARAAALYADALWNPPLGEGNLGAIDLTYTYSQEVRKETLKDIYMNHPKVKAGETVKVTVTSWQDDDKVVSREFSIKIPQDAPKGKIVLVVSDASGATATEREITGSLMFTDVQKYYRYISNIRQGGKLYLQLIGQGTAADFGTRYYHNLPANFVFMAKGAGYGSSGMFSKTLLSETTADIDLMIAGQVIGELVVY